jgi:hypothetical protein
MASKTVQLNENTFTKLDTGTATAIDAQNVSRVTVFVRFSATEPTKGDGGFELNPGDAVVRNGHADDMWGICEGAVTAGVEVGE